MSRLDVGPDPTIAARLRLAALPDGSRVRIIGRPGIFTWWGMDDGLARLRTPDGTELRAGCLAVEVVPDAEEVPS